MTTAPSGFVRIALQIRPPTSKERTEKTVVSAFGSRLIIQRSTEQSDECEFDRIMPWNGNEEAIKQAENERASLLEGVLADVFAGVDHCLVAYGSANTGGQDMFIWGSESFPILDKRGFAQLLVDELFLRRATDARFRIELTHVSISGEHVLDVLNSNPRTIVRLRETIRGTVSEQVTKIMLSSSAQFGEVLAWTRRSPHARLSSMLSLRITLTGASGEPKSVTVTLLDVEETSSLRARASSPVKGGRSGAVSGAAAVPVAAAAAAAAKKPPLASAADPATPGGNVTLERVFAGLVSGADVRRAVLPFHEDQLMWLAKGQLQVSSHVTLVVSVAPVLSALSEAASLVAFAARLSNRELASTLGSKVFGASRVYNKDPVLEEGRTCVMCHVQPISHALVPCGHFSFCSACIERRVTGRCPLCREPIAMKLRIRYAAPMPVATAGHMSPVAASPSGSLATPLSPRSAKPAPVSPVAAPPAAAPPPPPSASPPTPMGLSVTVTARDVSQAAAPLATLGFDPSAPIQALPAVSPRVAAARTAAAPARSPRTAGSAAPSPRARGSVQAGKPSPRAGSTGAAVEAAVTAEPVVAASPRAHPAPTDSAGVTPRRSVLPPAEDAKAEARGVLAGALLQAEAHQVAVDDHAQATAALAALLGSVRATGLTGAPAAAPLPPPAAATVASSPVKPRQPSVVAKPAAKPGSGAAAPAGRR